MLNLIKFIRYTLVSEVCLEDRLISNPLTSCCIIIGSDLVHASSVRVLITRANLNLA